MIDKTRFRPTSGGSFKPKEIDIDNKVMNFTLKVHLYLLIPNYAECIKIAVQKVVNKLSKSKKPQTCKALIKDIENQISNIKSKKKTTVKIKEILESNKDFPSKILNILDELDLIYIHKNDSKVASIEYYENLAERYEESPKMVATLTKFFFVLHFSSSFF